MTNKSDEQCFLNESSKVFTEEQLCNSPTLQKLSVFSRLSPINTNSTAEVEGALTPALVFLVDAVDNNTIQFKNKVDSDAFFQMMLICHQLITQIRPTSAVQH